MTALYRGLVPSRHIQAKAALPSKTVVAQKFESVLAMLEQLLQQWTQWTHSQALNVSNIQILALGLSVLHTDVPALVWSSLTDIALYHGQMQGLISQAHPVVPLPGFRIDGLSNSPQHLQGGGVTLLHMMVPFAHEGPDQRRSSVELLNLQHSTSRQISKHSKHNMLRLQGHDEALRGA